MIGPIYPTGATDTDFFFLVGHRDDERIQTNNIKSGPEINDQP